MLQAVLFTERQCSTCTYDTGGRGCLVFGFISSGTCPNIWVICDWFHFHTVCSLGQHCQQMMSWCHQRVLRVSHESQLVLQTQMLMNQSRWFLWHAVAFDSSKMVQNESNCILNWHTEHLVYLLRMRLYWSKPSWSQDDRPQTAPWERGFSLRFWDP